MSSDLTTRQQILLWDLVSRGGSALQKEIAPALTPADRTPLEERGYVTIVKVGRALRLTIEEDGWDHIATAAPSLMKQHGGSYHDRRVLQFVLQRIQAFASANEVPFARIFVAGRKKDDGGAVAEPTHGERSLEDEVREAFFAIAGRPPVNHVRLRALRLRLGDASRRDVDRTLRDMKDRRSARFSTLNNPPDIDEEGDAPLVVDGRTFHTIWIDP